MKRFMFLFAFGTGVLCGPFFFSAAAGAGLELEALVAEALARNPEIRAARERAGALRERVPQAAALEDPMIGFGILNVPRNFELDEEDMTAKELSLSQKLPFPGKLSSAAEAAGHEAEAAQAEAEETANRVAAEVKVAFHELSHVHRALEVTRRNQELLEELARIGRARYAVGRGQQEELLLAELDITQATDDLLRLEAEQEAARARLEALLDRPPGGLRGPPVDPEVSPASFALEELRARAAGENPGLKALRLEVLARRAELERARRELYPDFTLKFAYGQRDDRLDMLSGMVEMNVPIFYRSKQERGVAEALARVRAAESRLEAARNELFARLNALGPRLQALERRIALYRSGILPQARLRLESALSAYRVDRAGFAAVVTARMQLYRLELDYHEALTEHGKAIAALEAAVGGPLSPRR